MRKVILLITTAAVLGLTFALTSSARPHSPRAKSTPAASGSAAVRQRARVANVVAKSTRHRRGPQTISIPTIGIAAAIGTSLDRGPIYWERVGRPGQGTTVAIAGHDVTPVPGFQGHGPFYNIDLLRKGDSITLTRDGRHYIYRVTGQRVIPSTNLHIADLTRYERLLLTTCWPRGSSAYRLVVYARPA